MRMDIQFIFFIKLPLRWFSQGYSIASEKDTAKTKLDKAHDLLKQCRKHRFLLLLPLFLSHLITLPLVLASRGTPNQH